MAKGCALSTGYLPRGGLPRNSVDSITDRPDMTSVVDRGRKASTQPNPTSNLSAEPVSLNLANNLCCYGSFDKARAVYIAGICHINKNCTYKLSCVINFHIGI